MKSHEFAKHLNLMAKILKSGPNADLNDIEVTDMISRNNLSKEIDQEEIPHTLNLLVGLNSVSKQNWISLIEEFGFNIEIRARDANRDIVGKLINYLALNPSERDKLSGKKNKKTVGTSSELANALNILLK